METYHWNSSLKMISCVVWFNLIRKWKTWQCHVRMDDGFEIQLKCAAVKTVKHDCKICCKIYQQKWHNESMIELMAILADVNLGNPPEQKQFRPCKMKIVWKQVHEKKCAARWKVTLINPGKFQLRLLSIPRCLACLDVCISRCLAFLDASKCHLIRERNSLTILKFAGANKTCIQAQFQNIVKSPEEL